MQFCFWDGMLARWAGLDAGFILEGSEFVGRWEEGGGL